MNSSVRCCSATIWASSTVVVAEAALDARAAGDVDHVDEVVFRLRRVAERDAEVQVGGAVIGVAVRFQRRRHRMTADGHHFAVSRRPRLEDAVAEDLDRHGRRVGQLAIRDLVVEGDGGGLPLGQAEEVGARVEGDGAVRVQRDLALDRLAEQGDGQRVVLGVGVVGQDVEQGGARLGDLVEIVHGVGGASFRPSTRTVARAVEVLPSPSAIW